MTDKRTNDFTAKTNRRRGCSRNIPTFPLTIFHQKSKRNCIDYHQFLLEFPVSPLISPAPSYVFTSHLMQYNNESDGYNGDDGQ